jgi:hypothetical protein
MKLEPSRVALYAVAVVTVSIWLGVFAYGILGWGS